MFTHLHTHSFYSFNAGTIPATDLPLIANRAGMNAIAMTDTNNMSGIIEFYIACKKADVKPILGVELKTKHERAVLLARNNNGYREICETLNHVLESIPQTKPKLTLKDMDDKEIEPEITIPDNGYYPLAPFLSDLSRNVFILSSSPKVLTVLGGLKRDNVFIELVPAERGRWDALKNICRSFRFPVVATNNVYMGNEGDYELHRLLRAIGINTTLGNTPSYEIEHQSQILCREESLRSALKGVDDSAFRNAEKIAGECIVEFDLTKNKFTKYPCENPSALLLELAERGFQKRYPSAGQVHLDRFKRELEMIDRLDATSYFLVTHDMIEFAKSKDFPHIGRGSGANSLIAYCLEISNVDPIEHDLKFERFLNPERESPPDFDIDFSWNHGRYDVINYLLDKYGRDRSAMLCTIQCYRGKGGIREIGKALGLSESEISEQIALLRAVRSTEGENEMIRSLAETNSQHGDVQKWMTWANKVQGFPRHLSVHAGGVVIVNDRLSNYTPVQQAPIGVPITHLDMYSAEDIQLPKLDVLATRGLGTYWDTLSIIEQRYGFRPPVEHDATIAFNDEATRRSIREGKTIGVFYAESPASIGCIRKMQVDNFVLLYQALSVIRPGVASSGMMNEFIGRLRIPEFRSRAIPSLLKLLHETYGVMLFQEDVLEVAHKFAGLSYGQADLLRRAMSGKLRSQERMTQLEDDFIEGAIEQGHPIGIAQEVWRQVSSFAGYAFPKAHSASYSVLSFQEAWLKVYYPTEFLCSVLNNHGGYYRQQIYIDEAKSLGITIKIPDVNYSEERHTVENDRTIRLGFDAFKGVSHQSIHNLIANRETGGKYTSVEAFAIRSGVTQEDGMLMISLGACDSIERKRSVAGMKFGLLSKQKIGKTRQCSLEFPFESLPYDFSGLAEPDMLDIFNRERKTFSFSATNHPSDLLSMYADDKTVDGKDLGRCAGQRITVVGYYASSKTVTTKKGKHMLMLNLNDRTEMMDVVVWSEQYNRFYQELTTGQAFKITGRVVSSFDLPSLQADVIEKIEFIADPSSV